MSSHFAMKYSVSSNVHQSQVHCGWSYTSLQAKNKLFAQELYSANSRKYYEDLKGAGGITVRIQVWTEDSPNKKISSNGKPAIQELIK